MKKVNVVLNSTAPLAGDVIHPSIYGQRDPALVWTLRRRRGRLSASSSSFSLFCSPSGEEARPGSRYDKTHEDTFKSRHFFFYPKTLLQGGLTVSSQQCFHRNKATMQGEGFCFGQDNARLAEPLIIIPLYRAKRRTWI